MEGIGVKNVCDCLGDDLGCVIENYFVYSTKHRDNWFTF